MRLMRITKVSLGSNKQKYILQLIQALQNVHLILLGILNQFYDSFSALQRDGWQELHLLLTHNANEANAFLL